MQAQISGAINDSISLQNEQNKKSVDLQQILAMESPLPICIRGDFDSVHINLNMDSMIQTALTNSFKRISLPKHG
jgi:hypothetical protein